MSPSLCSIPERAPAAAGMTAAEINQQGLFAQSGLETLAAILPDVGTDR
jgi:hypothetical protein